MRGTLVYAYWDDSFNPWADNIVNPPVVYRLPEWSNPTYPVWSPPI